MIQAIIVDDEKPSISILKRLLINSGNVNVLACFDKPKDALDFVEKNCVDVAFLDIEMPEIDGFELANRITGNLNLNKRCAIVFVTAYNKWH